MDNDKFSDDTHTLIQYLLRKDEAPTETSDIPDGINRVEVRALQVTSEGSTYDTNNNDLYLKLFQSTNVSVSEPCVKKFSKTKYGRKAYFATSKHFMGDNKITATNKKAYLALEAAKYCGKLQCYIYETYVLIFEKNMRILSRNIGEMWDARVVQMSLSGIECPWFSTGKDFVTGSYAHKNDFSKTTTYLASFVQRVKGGGQNIFAFHAQGSDGRRHGGRFGCCGCVRGGCNGRGGQGGHGCGGGRGSKPDIVSRS